MYTIVWYIHTYFSDIPSFYSVKAFVFKTMKSFHVYHLFGIFTPILVSQ